MLFWCALGICLRETICCVCARASVYKNPENRLPRCCCFSHSFIRCCARLPWGRGIAYARQEKIRMKCFGYVCGDLCSCIYLLTYYASSAIKPRDYGCCRCIVSIFYRIWISLFIFSRRVNHNLLIANAHGRAVNPLLLSLPMSSDSMLRMHLNFKFISRIL